MEHEEVTEGHGIAIPEEVSPALADSSLVSLANQAEGRIEAMSKIKRISLQLTNCHDWVDQQGKPYLQASGSEKIARLFGVSWRISEPTLETEEGGHFNYSYKGEFSLAGATIEAIGTRSSKDGFFKKYVYEGPEGNKKRTELPVSEIDRGDVKKSAYTNLLGNGITRLLGIRNLTYDDLKEFAGITKEQVARVEYKKGGKPQGKPTPVITNPDDPISEAQAKAIYSQLSKLGVTDEYMKYKKISELLGMTKIPLSMKELTKGQASQAIEGLQKELGGTQ